MAAAREGDGTGQSTTHLCRREKVACRRRKRENVIRTCLALTGAVHPPTCIWCSPRRRRARARCNLLDDSRTEGLPAGAQCRMKAAHTQRARLSGRRRRLVRAEERKRAGINSRGGRTEDCRVGVAAGSTGGGGKSKKRWTLQKKKGIGGEERTGGDGRECQLGRDCTSPTRGALDANHEMKISNCPSTDPRPKFKLRHAQIPRRDRQPSRAPATPRSRTRA